MECDLYNLLDCKKEDLAYIDTLIEDQFKADVQVNDDVRLKSEAQKCKLYLK